MNEDPYRAGQGATGAEGVDQFQIKSTASEPSLQALDPKAATSQQHTDDTACQFLRLILPEHGPYALTVALSSGATFNEFAATIEDLWRKQAQWDARGATVYHACASFKQAKHDSKTTSRGARRFGRTAHNVAFLKAFRLDIDAGPAKPGSPPKPYKTALEAAKALLAFCQAAGLPEPMIVSSGNGLHAYWPLETALPPDEWRRYANGLKALCRRLNLRADAGKTADVSAVLRTPGTHNRKNGERQVRIFRIVRPYQLERFAALLAVPQRSDRSLSAILEDNPPPWIRRRPDQTFKERALVGLSDNSPSSAAIVAQRCAQIRQLREEQGRLVEPLWYASLGVLTFCVDGEGKAHEWSGGYDGYTYNETQERLDRAKQFGPTTCQKFRDLNPSLCKRCPWSGRIKSPIVLGRQGAGLEKSK
jgi:hypothetical protein